MSTCPDSNLYSALADGEVPSPWREKLEAHVASCPACQKRVARYRTLRSLLRDGAPNLSDDQLDASYLRLMAKRDVAREASRSLAAADRASGEDAAGTSHKLLKFPVWARASISLPLPALAALFAVAVFVPSWFALRASGNESKAAGYSTIIPAIRQTGESGMRALSTSNAVYSPDLPPETIAAKVIDPKNRQYFTMVEFARQFASDKELFSDSGGIVIIKLPSLTRFNTQGDHFLEGEEPLKQAAGFYR